jgi:hypothetical protein
MRIRIVKTPPAYVIDGFDMRGLRAGQTYELDARLANYVVMAGFGTGADEKPAVPKKSRIDESKPSSFS